MVIVLTVEDTGIGIPKEKQIAGHLTVNEKCGDNLFFWFFESRSDPLKNPIVIWLNGGPGSSSMMGLFAENGPYQIQDDLSLIENPYSWNTAANYLVIDQPAGTGLSYVEQSHDRNCYAKTEAQATDLAARLAKAEAWLEEVRGATPSKA